MATIKLDGTRLTLEDLYTLATDDGAKVEISQSALQKVQQAKNFINEQAKDKIIYGINTGFGPMASHIISDDQQEALQLNLIRSHAVGMGMPVESSYVLSAMTVRLNTLLKGNSGVSAALVERFAQYINHRIIPIIPEHGAVGTSGDLVQLAHIALAIIGEGNVQYKGKTQPVAKVLKELKLPPTHKLEPKEGLALINGTSVMAGISALLCVEARHVVQLAILSGAFSLELVHAYDDGISERLHAVRPHAGQVEVARKMRELLKGSKLLKNRHTLHETTKAQDDVLELPQAIQEVYSLRCTPQILGPVYDTVERTANIVETEINSVTDNPVVDWEGGEFLHGGNFHGDYVASAIDQLKAALAKLTMLSERRINFFLNKNVNKYLPPFLNLKKPGLTLGLQALQFVATSTTAQSQSYGYPHHLHSISTNGDNQDVVSMGTDASLIAAKVLDNAYTVLAIEFITLAQAGDFTKEVAKLSTPIRTMHETVRAVFPAVVDDRPFSAEAMQVAVALKQLSHKG